ncbi:MAG: 3-dehydroquinate synthase [Acidimicrobiia bacterium]
MRCGGSEIRMGRGLLTEVPSGDGQSAILTQPGAESIARSVAERNETPVLVLPDGEAAKTLEVAERTYHWLDSLNIDRSGTIVAVGGGTVTDLAGFVASTYLRGIRLVSVPTTLLGAVDASIGGKTAVNLDAKNLVGTFWDPTAVFVDIEILEQLPASLRREGMAEIAKAGLIGDLQLVEVLEERGTDAALDRIVRDAIAVKVRVVTTDPREEGVRAILNYGHTVGHAIELVTGIAHGDAVSIGMTAAAELSARLLGFSEAARQRALLAGLGLPTTWRCEIEPVMRLLRSDKKRRRGSLNMVLLERIGAPNVIAVGEQDVRSVLSDTLS